MSKKTVGIVGATGILGQELLSVLKEQDLGGINFRLFASKDSMGELYQVGEQEVAIEEVTEKALLECDRVVFATQQESVRQYIPALSNKRISIVDMTGGIRGTKEKLLSVPHSTAILMGKILLPLTKQVSIKRIVGSVFQSVSSAGKAALDELWSQTLGVFNQKDIQSEAFHQQIAFNCIPQIDVMLANGFSRDEEIVSEDIRKILGDEKIKCAFTSVRVPVFYGTGINIHVEFSSQIFPDDVIKTLSDKEGIFVYPDPSDYPMHMTVAGSNEVHVGRIRKDPSVESGLVFWIVADNIRLQALEAVDLLMSINVT